MDRRSAILAGALALAGLAAHSGCRGQENPPAEPAAAPRPPAALEKVSLLRVEMVTPAASAGKSIPAQTLAVYQGWVTQKALAVLAESGRACEVSVQATLRRSARPAFKVAAADGSLEPALRRRLEDELGGIDPLHAGGADVVFRAVFAVRGAVRVEPAAAPSETDPVAQACKVEIGMFCNAQKEAPAARDACLRQRPRDLLPACRASLGLAAP
ncbi:MAG: hypothetical protein HY926_02490 [Elusimicrobia bacterium]|nr:hypothetical protein [Elusimicrobiota bacterium]